MGLGYDRPAASTAQGVGAKEEGQGQGQPTETRIARARGIEVMFQGQPQFRIVGRQSYVSIREIKNGGMVWGLGVVCTSAL